MVGWVETGFAVEPHHYLAKWWGSSRNATRPTLPKPLKLIQCVALSPILIPIELPEPSLHCPERFRLRGGDGQRSPAVSRRSLTNNAEAVAIRVTNSARSANWSSTNQFAGASIRNDEGETPSGTTDVVSGTRRPRTSRRPRRHQPALFRSMMKLRPGKSVIDQKLPVPELGTFPFSPV